MNINQKTRLNMVIGNPLDHTQSPLLHTTIYETLGLPAVLLAFPHADLAALIMAIKTLSVELTTVTMPYKEQVLQYVDVQSAEVQALKAVNTLIQRDGKLYGYNTDVNGIEYALSNIELTEKNVLIIGAGGAAGALGYVLKKNQANLFWLNRTVDKAQVLASEFGGAVITAKDLAELTADIIINTTPIGMYPDVKQSPLTAYEFTRKQTVFDMVYNPVDTLLLKQAKSAGATVISGVEMFIGQALRQIELWQNLTKPLATDSRINLLKLKKLLTGTIK